jgi:hypothetical protein
MKRSRQTGLAAFTARVARPPLPVRKLLCTMERERAHMLGQFQQVSGLMPLLMKPRNKMRWSAQDKAELRAHLRRLAHLSPYVAVIVLPGGFAMLPVLAWWLDRRRVRRPLLTV